MDPVSTMIVGAIVSGAVAALKPVAEEAVKDTYAGLKRVITDRYNNHDDLIKAVNAVAKEPGDKSRQAALGIELNKAGATKDTVVIEAANAVHAAGGANQVKKRVLTKRIEKKLRQYEAENEQLDNTLDASQKIIIQDKIDALWTDIEQFEEELASLG